MVAPQFRPFDSENFSAASGRESEQEPVPLDASGQADPDILSYLNELVAAGYHGLGPILETISDTARRLTDASGAALAMWKDGAMVCRARQGEMAPPLGSKLDAETGISGECLRTGRMQHCDDAEDDARVDAEVCRSLGLRSIAVAPIQGAGATNGILLIFSTSPGAFTEAHFTILGRLAALAERARASEQKEAAAVPAKPQPALDLDESPKPGFARRRWRGLVWSAAGLVAMVLVAGAAWLGWRGPSGSESKAQAAPPASARAIAVNPSPTAADVVTADSGKRAPDNDIVWKPNPGGEPLLPDRGKSSAGTPVKLASQVEKLPARTVGASIVITDRVPVKRAPEQTGASEAAASAEPAPPNVAANPSDVGPLLSAKASLPQLSAPVSQGVSGGKLKHSVDPAYPASARQAHLEGKVVLEAMVMEDGSVGEVKVVNGAPLLAQSAVEAVKKWRYQPFQLDGKPVRNQTTITVEFKLPGPGH
jgi:protein TonB